MGSRLQCCLPQLLTDPDMPARPTANRSSADYRCMPTCLQTHHDTIKVEYHAKGLVWVLHSGTGDRRRQTSRVLSSSNCSKVTAACGR
jgi:hypothetical protein